MSSPPAPRAGRAVVLLLFLSPGCAPRPRETAPPPPMVGVRLNEIRVLGADPSATPEQLLGQPWMVRTDGTGNTYVGDRAAGAIKVYDPSGKYLRRIGRRGRGRGEIVEISCFELTADGELIVADGMNLRITRFSPTGDVLATYPIDDLSMLWPRRLRQIAEDRFLFLYKLPAVRQDGTNRPDARSLFHLYSGTFSEKLSAFGRFRDVVTDDGPTADRLMQLSPGRFWPEADGSILYAPGLYEGEIYRFRETKNGWRKSETLRGYVMDPRPFAHGEQERYAREEPTFRIRSRGGSYIGFHQNESRGLFRLRDSRIVHFTLIAEDGGRAFGVEIFDPDGTLRAYGPLMKVAAQPGKPTALPLHVEWKDPEDRFYLRWHGEDQVVVKVVRLEVTESEGASDALASKRGPAAPRANRALSIHDPRGKEDFHGQTQ